MRGLVALVTLLAVAAVLAGNHKAPITARAAHPRPSPVRTDIDDSMSREEVRVFYDILVASKLHAQLWRHLDGRLRRAVSVPPDARMARLYREMVSRAHADSFVFDPPELWRTDMPTDILFGNLPMRALAMHFPGPRRILVDGDYADRMTDGTLGCLLAHEIGHAVDDQSERVGHPVLEGLAKKDAQIVADEIAIRLCGRSNWLLLQHDAIHPPRRSPI